MTKYTITPTGISDFQVTCNTCGNSAVRATRVMAEASGNAHLYGHMDQELLIIAQLALIVIGGCWAGGTYTGKALEAYVAGDYELALAFALDQQALQH